MAKTFPPSIIIEEGAIRNDHEDSSCHILLKRGKDSLEKRERGEGMERISNCMRRGESVCKREEGEIERVCESVCACLTFKNCNKISELTLLHVRPKVRWDKYQGFIANFKVLQKSKYARTNKKFEWANKGEDFFNFYKD